MLLKYKFENFLSFKERVEFSMFAPSTKVKNRYPDNYVHFDNGYEVLKTAVIVGENAGGKSNFVKSLSYFKTFFQENEKVSVYKSLINSNNNTKRCPFICRTLQAFEIEVLLDDDCVYLYHLELDYSGIVRESLSYKNEKVKKYKILLIAERRSDKIRCEKVKEECTCDSCRTAPELGYELQIPAFDKSIAETLKNNAVKEKQIGLFITKLAILGDEHAIHFTEWVKTTLYPETNAFSYDLYQAIRNEEEDLRILHDPRYFDVFRMVDYSIVAIDVDDDKPYSKTRIIRKKENGETFVRELGGDSSGVREFFAWAVQIFRVVYENKVVFADEMDRVLNPVLSDRIISFINGKKHSGQFIFTSHNILHLDLKTNMKEQIYFITKNNETLNSELYSLADFSDIRYETTKIYDFYLKGILGGTTVE